MFTELQIIKIKELRKENKSGYEISKIIGKRKQDTLLIIRTLENKKEPSKSLKIIHTPQKYLKPKQLIKKEIIIKKHKEKREIKKPLTKKQKDYIKEQVNNRESDYKIIKEFKKKEKVRKEIKRIKNNIKKEKLKEINEKLDNQCKFNYITQHHAGYQFNRNCEFNIYINMSINDLDDIINKIIEKLNILNSKIICKKRFYYTTLEYIIIFNDEHIKDSVGYDKFGNLRFNKGSDKYFGNSIYQKGMISSKINETGNSFDNMCVGVKNIVYELSNLIHKSGSSKRIIIYNIIFVNFDFKYNIG